MSMILDILLDAVLDTLKLIPFLFVTYLLMEYLEHKTSEEFKNKIAKSKNAGPLIGGILGIVPQCGFSAAASNLYVGRVISLGTLITIYLSTSDEMLPILIAEGAPIFTIAKIITIKLVVGIFCGFVIDFIFKIKKVDKHEHIHEMCEHEKCHCDEGNILKSAIKHTLQITYFIFVINVILTALMEVVGEDIIAAAFESRTVLGPLLASLIGLIPNCGGSVALTKLYLEGVLGLGSVIGGLLTGCGVGLLVLFKLDHDKKECFFILGLLYVIGVISGIVIGLF